MLKNKKKAFLIGMGIFWGALAITTAISIPFIIIKKNNDKLKDTEAGDIGLLQTSLINVNDKQIQIKVENLEAHLGDWLNIEYKLQNSENLANNGQEIHLRSFYVSSLTEWVLIGGLVPNIKYDYVIKNSDGKEISKSSFFTTYSKPKLKISAEETSISFTSTEFSKDYLSHSIVVRYKIFDNSSSSPNKYDSTKELSVDLELKEENGKKIYVLSGTINDLEPSKPYILSLHIRGQEGTITDPIHVWTKGSDATLIVKESKRTSASIEISGLGDYVNDPNPDVQFYLSYVTKTDQTNVKKQLLSLGSDIIVANQLIGLKPNNAYSVKLVKSENGIEEDLTNPYDFWTSPGPFVKTKTFNGIETNWRKSGVNALLVISGLVDQSGDASKSLSHSDLEVVAAPIDTNTSIPDFASPNALKFNVDPADPTATDDYTIKLKGLMPGKMYALQIFEKIDTKFTSPLLENNFVNSSTPALFASEVVEVFTVTAKIKVTNVNNYKNDELVLRYWKESAPESVIDVKLNLTKDSSEVEILLENLNSLETYKYSVYPVYPELTTPADKLLEVDGSFTTKNNLSSLGLEGNNFTESIKFKLTGVSTSFPLNEEMKLQWRVKPKSETPWVAPSEADSKAFTLKTLPADRNYEVVINNQDFVNTWYTGIAYEWRLIKASEQTTNLIEEGSLEFILADDKITTEFTDKISISLKNGVDWRAPMYENIVASGLGDALIATSWRKMFGFTTKTQWRDFLEWIAFQDETVQNKFIENFVNAVKIYTTNAVNFTTRYSAVPYLPSNYGGVEENGDAEAFQGAATGNDGRFGGYTHSSYPEDTPIKPSDFMGANSKFKGYNEFPVAIKYYLQGIKEGWKHSQSNKGISRDNMFINGHALNKAETYASYLVKKQNLDGNFAISATTGQDSNGWTLETVENTSTDTNMWANDLTGELYVRVKATKDGKSNYYWHKIDGFKKATVAEPTTNDLSFELYPDHARSARIIDDELGKAADDATKKAIIEKYYKIRYASVYTEGWTFVSATLSADGSSIELKAKLPKKVIAKGTIVNNTDQQEVVSTTEFTYNLSGYDFASLPTLGFAFNDKQKGSLAPAASEIAETVRFVNANWTYEQMLNRMKDAVLQSDDQVKELANLIISSLSINSDWTNVNYKMYIRVIGGEPLANWGDYTRTAESNKINDANKNGFISTTILGTNSNEKRLELVIAMIKKYGTTS